MPNDRDRTVGTCFGAGTGAGTVRVRYGYDTWVRSVQYMGTVHEYGLRMNTVHEYTIWVHGMGTVGTVHGYGT